MTSKVLASLVVWTLGALYVCPAFSDTNTVRSQLQRHNAARAVSLKIQQRQFVGTRERLLQSRQPQFREQLRRERVTAQQLHQRQLREQTILEQSGGQPLPAAGIQQWTLQKFSIQRQRQELRFKIERNSRLNETR